MYIKNKIHNNNIVIHIRRKIHVINNLKTKLFLSMNILIFERIIIQLNNKKLLINNCKKLTTNIEILLKTINEFAKFSYLKNE